MPKLCCSSPSLGVALTCWWSAPKFLLGHLAAWPLSIIDLMYIKDSALMSHYRPVSQHAVVLAAGLHGCLVAWAVVNSFDFEWCGNVGYRRLQTLRGLG